MALEQKSFLDEAAEAEPISLIVAIQTGRSAWREFGREQGLSSMLLPILDQPGAQIAVLTFDSRLNLENDFTGNGTQIAACLHNLEPGDDGAAILDAVQYSVRLLESGARRETESVAPYQRNSRSWAATSRKLKMSWL